MFLGRTHVTCLTLPLYFTPEKSETSPQGFAANLFGFSLLRRSLVVLFTLISFSSCSELIENDSYDHAYDIFGNMENEDEFWLQIDTTHLLIEREQYAQAKAKLLIARESVKNKAHRSIINTISRKINALQRGKGEAFSVHKSKAHALDPYLQSTSTADLMLAYNLATSYIKEMAQQLGSIKFPGALDKRKHIVFYEGIYRIRSYAIIHTNSGKEIMSRFNCDIKLHKDRRNFTIQSLEIRK